MAEPETVVVQTGRCGCCPLYTIIPVPTYCSPTVVQKSVPYNVSVHLASGACVSGSWGVNLPTLDDSDPPVIPDHNKVQVYQRDAQATFVATDGFPGTVESTTPVNISLNGFPVRWKTIAANVFVLIWRPTGSADSPNDLFVVRTDPPPIDIIETGTTARTCISTDIVPDVVVFDDGNGPLQAFMTLRSINTVPFIGDNILPQGSIVFTRFRELKQMNETNAEFRSSAFAPITWLLNTVTP
jgi:hypothetical protein